MRRSILYMFLTYPHQIRQLSPIQPSNTGRRSPIQSIVVFSYDKCPNISYCLFQAYPQDLCWFHVMLEVGLDCPEQFTGVQPSRMT